MQVHDIPRVPPVAAGLAAVVLGLGTAAGANDPPAVVFKTRPRAVDGVISGRGPLDVTFNMCPTSDGDAGDQLKFTYDFNGDGAIDYYGHCRQTHRYPVSNHCPQATVCATDRQPGHGVCRTYSVCSTGSAPGSDPSPSPSPSPPPPEVSPDILPFTYDLYSFTAEPGTTVDVSVDTISAATAFDPWACISTTREGCVLFDENVVDWGDDDQPCTFAPPSFECPSFSATLPPDDDGVYYLLVSDAAEDDFVGESGMYALEVASDGTMGPLMGVGDNVPDDTVVAANATPQGSAGPSAQTPGAPGAARGRAPKAVPARPAPGRPAAPVPSNAPAVDAAPVRTLEPARPALPEAAPDPGRPEAPARGGAVAAVRGGAPELSFRTEPPATAAGVITGGPSFEVTFDLCGSKSPDAAREPSFRFDLDGDGVTDASAACRQTHRYDFAEAGARCVKSRACVGEGKGDHETCRTYTVCPSPSDSPRQ